MNLWRLLLPIMFSSSFGLLVSGSATAQSTRPQQILFANVNVFDGTSDSLTQGVDVLVEGNLIKELGPNLSAANATIIDGGGRTLIPGLIDGGL